MIIQCNQFLFETGDTLRLDDLYRNGAAEKLKIKQRFYDADLQPPDHWSEVETEKNKKKYYCVTINGESKIKTEYELEQYYKPVN